MVNQIRRKDETTETRTRVIKVFEWKLWGYRLVLWRTLPFNTYMQWYTDKHRSRIRAQRRANYQTNKNGQRDKKLKKSPSY